MAAAPSIYLVDGNSYVYRAYYAIPGLTNSKGLPTGAVYGFANMLARLIADRRPDALAVSFDTPEPTERHALFEAYKAHRPDTPEDLIAQMPVVKDLVRAMNIAVFEAPGYEADDVLATLARQALGWGMEVYIVTGDKDMLQLIEPGVLVYDPMKDRVMDEAYVIERFGVPPGRVVQYMALVGDSADNIPGIKGIGDKTAKALLSEFSSLDDMLLNLRRIPRERTRRLIEGGVDSMRMSERLATINREVPLKDARREALALGEPDYAALRRMYSLLEFHSLLRGLPSEATSCCKAETVLDRVRLDAVMLEMRRAPGGFAFDTETTGLDTMRIDIIGYSVCADPQRAYYVPVGHSYLGMPAQIPKAEALAALAPLMADPSIPKTAHNLKYDMLVLMNQGLDIRGELHDTMVASYLLDPGRPGHGLDNVSRKRLGRGKRGFKDVLGGRSHFGEVPLDEAAPYAAEDAELALSIRPSLYEDLGREGLMDLYQRLEMPITAVLARMEFAGVMVDSARLGELSREIAGDIAAIERRIYFHAGREFNINSPGQLAGVLFDELGLKASKKIKTGFSTDAGVLEELSALHPLPAEVLEYRTLTKLQNTYMDVLPRLVNPRTGRIHTSFNQCVTATGRLSSSDPNLQNIPVRGDWGQRIRECFVAPPGRMLISADYSQIELRILAHLSRDEAMIRAFGEGLDIHTATAAEIFGVAPDKVNRDMRRVAKSVNFGVVYGMSAFGLAGALGIPRSEASGFIERYFARYEGVRAYIGGVIEDAKRAGFVRTMMGRKRAVPELHSRNKAVRQQGERLAVNTVVQGSAADIIKVAMINADAELARCLPGAALLIQVHDELVVEAPEAGAEAALGILARAMGGAAALSVPLVVDASSGRNWAEAH